MVKNKVTKYKSTSSLMWSQVSQSTFVISGHLKTFYKHEQVILSDIDIHTKIYIDRYIY